MKVTITKEKLVEAILHRLKKPIKRWQLAVVYNGLFDCSVVEINEETGEIECDEDDAGLHLDE